MRKHVLIFLALWLGAVASLCAQGVPLFVSGTVTNYSGAAVAGQPVIFTTDTSGNPSSLLGVAYTSPNGWYADTLFAPMPVNGTVGVVYAITPDCNGNPVTNLITYTPNGVTTGIPANFVICSSSCAATLMYTTVPTSNTVTFTANATVSSPNNISYEWHFGDGTVLYSGPTSSSTNVQTHTYANSGYYGVFVIVYDSIFCAAVAMDSIVVGNGQQTCMANFFGYFDPTNTLLYLYDLSSSASGAMPAHSWTLSDGQTSNQQNPVFQVTAPSGPLGVCLTITDSLTGCTSTWCDSVYPNTPPSCVAGFSYTTSGNTVSFVDLSTFANPNGTHSYYWDFGDGNSSQLQNPVHTYAQPGIYHVSMFISDSLSGCYDFSFQTIAVGFNSNCAVIFSYYGAGNTQYFYPYSITGIPPSPSASYTWDFGDGNTGTGYSPMHTYAQSGVYGVCMTVADSGCTFTWCDSVYVGNYLGCDAAFSYYEQGAYGLVDFYSNNWGWSATENWDFGDGSTGVGGWPTHQYTANGTYTVCHYVSDSLSNCTDSFCTQITVTTAGATGGCQASYYWTPDPVDSLKMYFAGVYYNLFGDSATTWNWSFGDGSSSSLPSTSHTYAASGTYLVCLTATDSLGCTSTYCDSVFVNTFPVSQGNVYGQVFAGQQPADFAKVYLITLDPTSLALIAADSLTLTPADSGSFMFANIPSGLYTVKAALDTPSASFANYMPTYYGDSLFWLDAQWFVAPGTPSFAQINLAPGVNTGGPGFIGGSIFAGANKNSSGMANVHVMLLDNQMNAVAHTISDADGKFNFAGLPMGDYMVYVDMLNHTTTPAPISLKQGTHFVNNLEIQVHSTQITFDLSTSIAPEVASLVGDVYPNPTTGTAALDLRLERAADVRVEVLSVLGTSVWSRETALAAGNNTLPMNLEALPAGVYLVRVQSDATTLAIRRVVKD